MRPPAPRTPAGWLAVLLLVAALGAAPTPAKTLESFAAGPPTWRILAADAEYRVLAHHRSAAGRRPPPDHCERLTLIAGPGQQILWGQPLPAARLVEELAVTVWIRSDRDHLRLVGRVTFPNARAAQTGEPVTARIWGDTYVGGGEWRPLRLTAGPNRLRDVVRALRAEHGAGADLSEPVLDLIAVNVFAEAGPVTVDVDTLEIEGFVPLRPENLRPEHAAVPVAAESSSGSRPPWVDRAPDAAGGRPSIDLRQGRVEVAGRPVFVSAIEHRGEPLAMLKELGFSAARLPRPPTPEQNAEATRLGLWLIAPPPQVPQRPGLNPPNAYRPDDFSQVIAWEREPSEENGDVSDRNCVADRPLVSTRLQAALGGGRRIVWLDRSTIGGTLSPRDYGRQLRQARQAAPLAAIFASVPTQPAAFARQQWQAMGLARTPVIELDQLRVAAFSAVASGATGLIFTSDEPLDANTPQAAARRSLLATILGELAQATPWAAARAPLQTLDTNHPAIQADSLNLEHARLVILWRTDDLATWTAGPADQRPVSILAAGTPESFAATRLTPAGPYSLQRERGTGGLRVELLEPPMVALVLLSQDRAAVAAAQREERGRASAYADNLSDIVDREFAETETSLAKHGGLANAPELAAAAERLRRAEAARRQGAFAPACVEYERALARIGMARRQRWMTAASTAGSPATHPLLCCLAGTATAMDVTRRFETPRAFGQNLLPGGDFESLDAILAAGWRNWRRPDVAHETAVDVSADDPRGGQRTLRITRASHGPQSPDAGEPAVVITSPAIPLQPGDLVRIDGWTKVSAAGKTQEAPRLTVFDSLGGEALAARIGSGGGWRRFTLYRAAPHSGDVRVTFALTGEGMAWLDDISLRLFNRKP